VTTAVTVISGVAVAATEVGDCVMTTVGVKVALIGKDGVAVGVPGRCVSAAVKNLPGLAVAELLPEIAAETLGCSSTLKPSQTITAATPNCDPTRALANGGMALCSSCLIVTRPAVGEEMAHRALDVFVRHQFFKHRPVRFG